MTNIIQLYPKQQKQLVRISEELYQEFRVPSFQKLTPPMTYKDALFYMICKYNMDVKMAKSRLDGAYLLEYY